MPSQVQDEFKPTAPPEGRDWLTKGFGIHRCTCARCLPPPALLDDKSTVQLVLDSSMKIGGDVDEAVSTELYAEGASRD